MPTYIPDWTEAIAIHASSTITNGNSTSDNLDLDNDGYFGMLVQIDIDISAATPAGDIVIEVFGSADSGTNKDTIAMKTVRIPFTAVDHKIISFPLFGVPYATVKVSNNTGQTCTYIGRAAGMKQAS